MKEQENTLYVQMLGGFSMTWNGTRMEADPKGRDSQSVRLLEAIIHSGKKACAGSSWRISCLRTGRSTT